MRVLHRVVLTLASLGLIAGFAQPAQGADGDIALGYSLRAEQVKPIPIILSVESQGSGGFFMGQAAVDLSPAELRQFRGLIEGEIAKLPNHKIVPMLVNSQILS